MSDFRVPVRGGIWSLRTDADLGGGEGLALWLPEAGSGTPGSWGAGPWRDGLESERSPSALIQTC